MFGRNKEPEPEAKPENTDIEDIKRWITKVTGQKFKDLEDREQRNKDYTTRVNDRCRSFNNDTRTLWKEKDQEKEALKQVIKLLKTNIRDLKGELDKKANRAKPSPDKASR